MDGRQRRSHKQQRARENSGEQERSRAENDHGEQSEGRSKRKFSRGDPRPVEQIPCQLGRIPAEEILRRAAAQTEPQHWQEERQDWYQGWEDSAEQQPSALQQDEAGGQMWAQQQDQEHQEQPQRPPKVLPSPQPPSSIPPEKDLSPYLRELREQAKIAAAAQMKAASSVVLEEDTVAGKGGNKRRKQCCLPVTGFDGW